MVTGIAVVSFATEFQSASQDDVLVNPTGVLTLQDGQQLGHIVITLVDDSLPELTEELYVRLVNTTGDTLFHCED